MIFGTLIVGGITRLTHSGLSMVEWQPLIGVIPPTNETKWNEVFEKYQQFPEYQKLNIGMTLAEFKTIFYWEYLHRIFGRVLGLVFLIPWIYFMIRKRFTVKYNLKLLGILVLIGAQGVLGWYMVTSGLIDNPRVSHYRLAAHLSLAMALLGVIVYQILNLKRGATAARISTTPALRYLGLALTILASIQIIYGAFMAGLNAGYTFNTFPTLAGHWIPPNMFDLHPLWSNFFNNQITVHFLHRTFGWLILFGAVGLWIYTRSMKLLPEQRLAMHILTAAVSLQFLLGVLAVINGVPTPLAVLHQAGAALLFVAAINVNHLFRR